MSKAKYPNRDALRQANDIYLDAIYPFVIRCLDKVKGATAEELIKNALRLALDDDIEEKVEISDIAHLVRTYWYDFFEGHFDAVDRHYEARSAIGLIVEGRNRASHRPWDLDPEFTRTQLFLIAEVLGKINMSDAQREVEVIREELFNDTTGQLVTIAVEDEKAKYEKSISELEKCLTAEKEKNKKLSKEVDDNAAELDIKKEELEKRSGQLVSMRLSEKKNKKQFNSISEKLKKLQEAHNTCDERLTAISDQLTSTEAERDDYKGRFETASEQLDEVNERLSLISDQFLAVKAERDTSTEHLTVIQKLLTASTISDQSVYPPLKTDSAVRILDRRGTDKRSYLLELLEQEQTAIIYVQSEERIDQLLTLVGPEKADVIGACNERTSETVEDDNTVNNENTETKPTRANAKVTEEQVREIRSRSAAGESNGELAEEDSEKKPEVKQSEFWQPIRAGEFGALFAGRPVPVRDDGWISKQIRGVEIILSFRKNRSYVSFLCTGENRIERRDEIIALFSEADYDYYPRESDKRAGFGFPVINKGKDHPEDWDEIRKKLVAMGTDVYNKIDESAL